MNYPIDLEWTKDSLTGLQVRFTQESYQGSTILFIPESDDNFGLKVGREYSGYPATNSGWKPVHKKPVVKFNVKDYK